jgi:uncharacterized damage-inducible protein DinB
MSTTLTHDLHDQLSRAIDMLRFTMRLFSPEEYITGLDFFDTPARLAWHTIESLDLYFTDGEASAGVDYGYRFGGTPHWKLPDEAMPAQGPMLEYLDEVEARIQADFSALRDEDLSTPFERYDWSGKTLLGHYVYAIRHTMEHHGQLCVIATHFGHTEESWR